MPPPRSCNSVLTVGRWAPMPPEATPKPLPPAPPTCPIWPPMGDACMGGDRAIGLGCPTWKASRHRRRSLAKTAMSGNSLEGTNDEVTVFWLWRYVSFPVCARLALVSFFFQVTTVVHLGSLPLTHRSVFKHMTSTWKSGGLLVYLKNMYST